MKKNLLFVFIFIFFTSKFVFATLNYSFTAIAGTYSANAGGTPINELYAGADAVVSASYPIGFNFVFDGTTYSTFKVSDNGCFFFGDSVLTGDPASGDAIIPNDMSIANSTRPFAAPLWDDLAVFGSANYLVTGIAPARVLTVEWNQIDWMYNVAQYGGNHNNISFQLKLYETTNVIEFVYNQQAGSLANCPSNGCGSASIGLAGINAGDYYSLDGSGASPAASKTVNTTSIYTKPSSGQIYRWTPTPATAEESFAALQSISVFPNPSQDIFTFSFSKSNKNEKFHLMIRDVFGKLVMDKLISPQERINLSADYKGVYLYTIINKENEIISGGKLVKQ